MSIIQVADNFVNSAADTIESVFKASSKPVVIESFTAANNSSVNASYKAYIVSSDTSKPQIPFKVVVWGENDLGIGIVGQVIPVNSELKVESSAINSIYFTVTGREIEET